MHISIFQVFGSTVVAWNLQCSYICFRKLSDWQIDWASTIGLAKQILIRLLVYCLVSSGWGSLSVHAEALVSWTRRHQYWRAGLVHFLFYTLADGSLTCVVWGWLSFKIILVFVFIQVQVTVRIGDLKERSLLIPQVKSTCNVINWV